MKYLIVFIPALLFISSLSFGDSVDTEFKQNNSRLNKIESTQKNTIDSLHRELLLFKAKEDYYAEALGDQSNRFALIAGSLFGLSALLSFAGFKREVNSLKKDYNNQVLLFRNELTLYQRKTRSHDISMQSASGRIFTLIGQGFKKDSEHILAFEYFLYSTKAHSQSYLFFIDDKKDTDAEASIKAAVANLELAITSLKTAFKTSVNINAIKEINEKIIKVLIFISKTEHEELSELCAECRILVKDFIKESL